MASLGARLKEEREKRGVTLDEISRATKIGTRMLRALEEEHFDQLPGGIFNKGFIRAYARFLGIDEEQAIADYVAATGVQPGKKPDGAEELRILEQQAEARSSAPSGLPWGMFAVVLLIAALGFALWGFYSREGAAKPTVQVPPASENKTAPSVPQNASSQDIPVQPAAVPASAPPAQSSAPHPARPSEAAAAVKTESGAAIRSTASAGSFVVSIKAREDSWISITVDGEVTMRNTLLAPARKSVRAQNEIVVKVGNASGLDFEFNGKPVPVQGAEGEVKTLTFDAKGLQPPAPKTPSLAPAP